MKSRLTASLLLPLIAAACFVGSSSEPEARTSSPTRLEPPPVSTGGDAGSALDGDWAGHAVQVRVNPGQVVGSISPLILGVSAFEDQEYLHDLGITLTSWGGNPSTRYNYEIGNAWNAGADWGYRNGNYGISDDAALGFIRASSSVGAQVRLAVPTLGWVARDDSNETCSFPAADGSCDEVPQANCERPGPIADPHRANVRSTPEMVRRWVERLVHTDLVDLSLVAFDNEPELWGINHYDVHPTCTTYEEILDRYLEYARALREVVPDASFAGPVTCCWFPYWRLAPGPADGPMQDFIPWFLDQVRHHDSHFGRRTLDVLDVHYYPQSEIYNADASDETAARRLRSTRALFDFEYVDESWIGQPIAFIPRLREVIDRHYPGTKLAITEWNFGADTTMNGALAIADVLAIFGREGVHAAAYWVYPPPFSPGYFAFKMHGNYDGEGSRFGDTAVTAASTDPHKVRAYAAVDGVKDRLLVMLLNIAPDETVRTSVDVSGSRYDFTSQYRYSNEGASAITKADVNLGEGAVIELPPYSITLLVSDADVPR
jgi:hypothetical protein